MGKIKKLWDDRKNQSKYFKWLMHYTKPYIGRISLMMIINIFTTVVSLVMAQVTKEIIDRATGGVEFYRLIAIYVGMVLVTMAISMAQTLVATMLSERFSFGIRKQLYDKILNSHWMDVKKYHTGDLMTRLTSDAGNIADGIINTIPSIIQLIVELILVFAMLCYYSPLLAVFSLLVAPVAAITAWWLGKKLKKLQVKVQESEANYRSFLQESMANLLVVKAFANEKASSQRLSELREERFKWVFKRTKFGLVSSGSMSLSFQIGYIVAFSYGAIQISKQLITYGTMSVFLTLVNRVQAPVMGLAQQIPKVVSVLASAGRVMELQDIPAEEHSENTIAHEHVGVKAEGLTFGYVPEETVLNDVSFDIKPGEFVAIIGESGIGKTTLIRLLMSFMSDRKGTIAFYNEQEEEFANASSRDYIAYVPQGNTLFSGTIRANIQMGNLSATEEEMWEALKLSAGYDFVKELPKGLDTVIGERGHGLSEGQAQRIAIARAFVRKAPFLILDEATSALDEKTEQEVIKGLQMLEPRPTCLVVTHRKSILQYCNRELKIENGQLSEEQL